MFLYDVIRIRTTYKQNTNQQRPAAARQPVQPAVRLAGWMVLGGGGMVVVLGVGVGWDPGHPDTPHRHAPQAS